MKEDFGWPVKLKGHGELELDLGAFGEIDIGDHVKRALDECLRTLRIAITLREGSGPGLTITATKEGQDRFVGFGQIGKNVSLDRLITSAIRDLNARMSEYPDDRAEFDFELDCQLAMAESLERNAKKIRRFVQRQRSAGGMTRATDSRQRAARKA